MRLFRTTAIFALANSMSARAFNDKDGKDGKDSLDFLKNLSQEAKKGMDDSNPDSISKYISKTLYDDLSRNAYDAIETGIPGKIGYGFLMGYSTGFCMKKVSKIVAFSVGALFILVQGLSYNGFITVDHKKLKQDIESTLDLNKDGKLDEKDLQIAYEEVNKVLSFNLPSGGGFTGGFVMGIRG